MLEPITSDAFWVVISPTLTNNVLCRFDDFGMAKASAETHARCNKGHGFFVMQAVIGVQSTDIQVVEIKQEKTPF